MSGSDLLGTPEATFWLDLSQKKRRALLAFFELAPKIAITPSILKSLERQGLICLTSNGNHRLTQKGESLREVAVYFK